MSLWWRVVGRLGAERARRGSCVRADRTRNVRTGAAAINGSLRLVWGKTWATRTPTRISPGSKGRSRAIARGRCRVRSAPTPTQPSVVVHLDSIPPNPVGDDTQLEAATIHNVCFNRVPGRMDASRQKRLDVVARRARCILAHALVPKGEPNHAAKSGRTRGVRIKASQPGPSGRPFERRGRQAGPPPLPPTLNLLQQ